MFFSRGLRNRMRLQSVFSAIAVFLIATGSNVLAQVPSLVATITGGLPASPGSDIQVSVVVSPPGSVTSVGLVGSSPLPVVPPSPTAAASYVLHIPSQISAGTYLVTAVGVDANKHIVYSA